MDDHGPHEASSAPKAAVKAARHGREKKRPREEQPPAALPFRSTRRAVHARTQGFFGGEDGGEGLPWRLPTPSENAKGEWPAFRAPFGSAHSPPPLKLRGRKCAMR
ncbi:hypothetical protein MRX96_037282 [Rhipicephalus microplus]